jgi:surface carbohydrate biosynthesis protein
MFKKIFKLVKLLLEAGFYLKNPNTADIIIFDKTGSQIIKKVLSKKKIKKYILESRIQHIKKIFLSKKIIFFIIKNIFNYSLKICYLAAVINQIKPRIIITFIDTSKDFHILSKIFFKKITCISFQQGERTFITRGKNNITDCSYKELKKYFIPEFYVFSEYDKKFFQSVKAKINNYEIVGSINASLAKISFRKKKLDFYKTKYDFCLISDTGEPTPCGLIFKYLHKLCIDENLSYVIAGDTDTKKSYELDYYKSFSGSKKINLVKNEAKSYSSYLLGLRSNVIIGYRSTMIKEFIGFKKKVIAVNGSLNNIGSLNIFKYKKKKNYVEWKAKANSYKNFSTHALKVLRMSNRQYFNIFKNYKYFMHYDSNIINILRKKISMFLK